MAMRLQLSYARNKNMRQEIQNAAKQFDRLARAIWGDRIINAMRPSESARECSLRLKKQARERAEKIQKARA